MKKLIITFLVCLPLLSLNGSAQDTTSSGTKKINVTENYKRIPNVTSGVSYSGVNSSYATVLRMDKTTFASSADNSSPVIHSNKIATTVNGDKTTSGEKYGKTLNAGLGIGYYGYLGHSIPVLSLNYEFDVAQNFTLAPFAGFYSYSNNYYYGDPHNGYRYYAYHETVIPIGVKGTYYFDQLLNAGSKWDFYLAASLGYAIVNSSWENGYYGDRNVYHGNSTLYLDAHIGTEYHISDKIGVILDLSTGISTIGIAIHQSN